MRSLRERLGALRNLPPFLKLVWQTSPALTAADLVLRLVRALLPVATLYVGKLIIDEVVRLAQAPARGRRRCGEWLASGLLDRIGCAARARVRAGGRSPTCWAASVSLLDSLLSERFTNDDQPSADGARGDARPRGLRGQRAAGPAGARAAAGRGPHRA